MPISLNIQSNIGDVAGLYVNNLQSPKALDANIRDERGNGRALARNPSLEKALQVMTVHLYW